MGYSNLHVYGDFLKVFDINVSGKLSGILSLREPLGTFQNTIFLLYGSYILSKAGYNIDCWCNEDFYESSGGERLYTTEFTDKDWIDNLFMLEGMWDFNDGNADIEYANKKRGKIKIFYINSFIDQRKTWIDYIAKDTREDEISLYRKGQQKGPDTQFEMKDDDELARDIAEKWYERFDKNMTNYVVVSPVLNSALFLKAKNRMNEFVKDDVFLASWELSKRFIPNKKERQHVEEGWKSLFKALVTNFKARHPFLVYSEEQEKISNTQEWLKSSRNKLEGGNIDDAIRDAGLVCEAILQILGKIHKIEQDESEYNFLLNKLSPYIYEEYGEEVYNDLDFIRKWRNAVSHPHKEKPNINIATQVVRRAELFFELFDLKRRSSSS